MKRFMVVQAHTAQELEAKVNKLISSNFEPVGGVVVIKGLFRCTYTQSMYRPDGWAGGFRPGGG